jgi:hypothetical protein
MTAEPYLHERDKLVRGGGGGDTRGGLGGGRGGVQRRVDGAHRNAVAQGLTLVHLLIQRKHFSWETLGTLIGWTGHTSPQTEHKTAR